MKTARVGLIGAGYWGPNLGRNFYQMDTADLVVVADLDPKRLEAMQERFPNIETTRRYQDLFDMDLDAVIIATPPITHFAFASEFLKRGISTMVEKPLVLESKHGERLIQLAEENNATLMVGHTFEYNSAVRKIKEIIDSGELGEIFYIDAVRANLGLFQPNVNAMWDLAPHDISIILYLLGREPQSVSAQGGQFVTRNVNVHDVVYMHMNFDDGIRANIRLSWLDPNKTRTVTIVGSKKMLVYDDVAPREKIKIYDKGVKELPHSSTFEEFECSYRYGDIITPFVEWEEPLRVECEHFIDCVMNGKTPLSDGHSGLRVVRVLEAADKSLADDRFGHVPFRETEENKLTTQTLKAAGD